MQYTGTETVHINESVKHTAGHYEVDPVKRTAEYRVPDTGTTHAAVGTRPGQAV